VICAGSKRPKDQSRAYEFSSDDSDKENNAAGAHVCACQQYLLITVTVLKFLCTFVLVSNIYNLCATLPSGNIYYVMHVCACEQYLIFMRSVAQWQ